MPDLGKKYECFNCGTKFYNLGKPEAICPKCGANQKDAKSDDAPPPPPRPPRRSVIMEPIPEENPNEFGEEVPAARRGRRARTRTSSKRTRKSRDGRSAEEEEY